MKIELYFIFIQEILIIGLLVALAQSTSWNFCKKDARLPIKSLWIHNCPGPNDLPCPLYIGNDIEVKVEFEASKFNH